MGLITPKSRPIEREVKAYRDDRIFFIACDDTYAPKQYFESFRIPRIKIDVVPTVNGTSAAETVLARLDKVQYEEGDERWIILDTDHYIAGPHLRSFTAALQQAKQKGINVALSRPCFEVWLALHFVDDVNELADLTDATEVESFLKQKLGVYNKTKIDTSSLSYALVRQAYLHAAKLDATVSGGDIPDSLTTRIYLLWQAILSKSIPTQLPDDLRRIVDSAPRASSDA
jgi:hypothetical protein